MVDYLHDLELSIKTTNLLRLKHVTEQQFLRLTKEQFRAHGGLIRGWKEIEQVKPMLLEMRKKRRRESTIGRACIAAKELNDLRADLRHENLFITVDNDGVFRIGRYITREELKDGGDR
jgi:hypothetical protein